MTPVSGAIPCDSNDIICFNKRDLIFLAQSLRDFIVEINDIRIAPVPWEASTNPIPKWIVAVLWWREPEFSGGKN